MNARLCVCVCVRVCVCVCVVCVCVHNRTQWCMYMDTVRVSPFILRPVENNYVILICIILTMFKFNTGE